MDERTERFIERMGMFTEAEGFPRIAGRIFAFLLLESEPCSLDDLADALGVSKASVSTDTRRLEQLGFLERHSRPGDRRDYYAMADDVFVRSLEARLRKMKGFHALIEEAAALPVRDPRVRKRLDTMERAYRLAMDALIDALARWEREQSTAPTRRH